MRGQPLRDFVLPGIGLGSLVVYIIACSQFSPDDSKVAYPAFDERSGAVCVSVYDRKTETSEVVFVASRIGHPKLDKFAASYWPRPAWLPDGRRILVACVQDDFGLLALVPFRAREPVRLLSFSEDVGPGGDFVMTPFVMSGSKVFLPGEKEPPVKLLKVAREEIETQ